MVSPRRQRRRVVDNDATPRCHSRTPCLGGVSSPPQRLRVQVVHLLHLHVGQSPVFASEMASIAQGADYSTWAAPAPELGERECEVSGHLGLLLVCCDSRALRVHLMET